MKRVLAVSNTGDLVGGGEISLLQLVRHLDPKRYKASVLCPFEGSFWGRLRDEKRFNGGPPFELLPTFAMPGLKGLGLARLPMRVRRLARKLRRDDYALVHANGSRSMVYAGLAARLAGIPSVWHVRVTEAEWLDRLLAPLADRIVVNSEAVAERFTYAASKVQVVHNGVDLANFDPLLRGDQVRCEFGIPAEAPVAALLGRLERNKGQADFLKCAAQLVEKYPLLRIFLAGDGPLRSELQAYCRQELRLEGKVVFAGHRHDAAAVLAASDIVVSASRSEGFGRVLIEAMAMAKPVVATRTGGACEVVAHRQTGLLVALDDHLEMAEAIERLLERPDLRSRMGAAGRQRVEQNFSAHRHALRMEAVYDSLLG